jgi:hypothetical protein
MWCVCVHTCVDVYHTCVLIAHHARAARCRTLCRRRLKTMSSAPRWRKQTLPGCVRACVHAYVHACVRARARVDACAQEAERVRRETIAREMPGVPVHFADG